MKWTSINGLILLPIVGLLLAAPRAQAHCDTLDGPVVNEARQALESADVTPVLKWIAPEDEEVIREAFEKTINVREGSEDARELADRWFFETVVRVHRASEGAPYTGLKPAGTPVEPGIAKAEAALKSGEAEELVATMAVALEQGLRQRLERVSALHAHANESVEAGREYVEAYVEYIHYVEGVHQAIAGGGHGHAGGTAEHSEHEAKRGEASTDVPAISSKADEPAEQE